MEFLVPIYGSGDVLTLNDIKFKEVKDIMAVDNSSKWKLEMKWKNDVFCMKMRQ